jgi:hypothetical protein
MKPKTLERRPIDRRAFIERFMRECGLTYAQACSAYDCLCRCVADGIVYGSKISLGRVGAIKPVWQPARDVNMHFTKVKGGKVVRGVHRTYNLDGRYKFTFKLYRRFIDTPRLRWFLDTPDQV